MSPSSTSNQKQNTRTRLQNPKPNPNYQNALHQRKNNNHIPASAMIGIIGAAAQTNLAVSAISGGLNQNQNYSNHPKVSLFNQKKGKRCKLKILR